MVIENITYFLFIFSILVIGRSLLRLISFLLQNVNDSKLLYSNGELIFLSLIIKLQNYERKFLFKSLPSQFI
jgi:hypothetical protein